MAIETKKELNVDIDLNTKAIKEQTQIIVQSFQEIGKQIQDLSNIIKGIGTSSKSLDNVNNTTKKISQNTEETKRKTDSANKSTVSWFKSLSKIGLTIAGFRRLGQTIGELVKESGSWIENLNLFEVTFGDTYKKSLDWSIEFAENLGFSVNEMVKFTGLFKQLSTSIGIAQETGDKLAETLTSIGTDITSFYNLSDVETAMEKLQAGIFSGQTKPLRSIGIDVTYQSIDNLLKTNEALAQFNTTSKKLDQSQKALARTILVLQGARNAFGDTQKTINSLSNQIRVFQGSLQNLKLALGDTFAEPFRQALIYVNGFIIALTDIIRMFVDLKTSTGNPLPDGTIVGQINDELEELEQNEGLLSFDKFNVADSGSDNTNLSITEALTEELNKQIELYDSISASIGDIRNKAQEVAESIKNWLVIVDENGKFVDFTDNVKTLFSFLVAIFGTAMIAKIVSWGKAIYTAFMTATSGASALTIASSLLRTSGLFLLIYSITELVTKWDDLDDAQKAAYATLSGLGAAMIIFSNKTLLGNLVKSLTTSKNAMLGLQQASLTTRLAVLGIGAAVGYLVGEMLGELSSGIRLIIGVLLTFIGVATAAAIAMGSLQSTWSLGLAAGAIVAGIVAITSAIKDANASGGLDFSGAFADGGIPRTGSLFIAGESGAEFVTNMGNNQTGVTNIQQFKMATLEALLEYNRLVGSDNSNKVAIDINVSPREMARVINPYIKTENARGGNR